MSHELIDTHCHLDFPEFDPDRQEVVSRANKEGIQYIVNIGSSLQGSRRSVGLAQEYECVYATVGIHPHEADRYDHKISGELKELARRNKVVAIGEIGLDYYKNYSRQENQRSLFASLLQLAKEAGLPVVLHNRQAEADTLKLLKEVMPVKAVVHCFSGDEVFLRECLDLGLFVSFTCNITYKKAQKLRDLVRVTPIDRLMLETDAPFLSPDGFRGKRNEPGYVKLLAEEVARIKQVSVEEIARATTGNARSFFKIGH
jgi:TatD DNase family protein